MFTASTTKETTVIVTAEASGTEGRADYGYLTGQIIKVINGKVPAVLARCSQPYDGPYPPHRTIDSAEYHKRAQQPQWEQPQPAAPLTHEEVLARFDWTPDDFAIAKQLGFPSGTPRTSASAFTWKVKQTVLYRQRDVDLWAERVKRITKSME